MIQSSKPFSLKQRN